MIKALYYSGLISTTLAGALLVVLVALIAIARREDRSDPSRIAGAATRLLSSWLFLGFITLGTLVNTGYGIYKGYVVPRDYIQDVISAREFLAGKSLYPGDMTKKFVDLVHETPPSLSIWPAGSTRRIEEQEARDEAAASPWVQAHPPLMTLFFAPLVRLFGTYGTYLAISILSIASLVATPIVIARTLKLELPKVLMASLIMAILGWAATIEDFRDGQSGPYLTLLCVLGWSFLRSGKPWAAGIAVGIAASLKLYPGIILFYFLLKDRRAFVAGIATVGACMGLSGLLCGPRVFLEYIETARFVSDYYSHYSSNISLLACLLRIVGGEERQATAKAVWFGFAIASVIGTFLVSRQVRVDHSDPSRSIDLEYSFFLALGVLLTPVAWDHYTIMLLLPLAVLAKRELRGDASESTQVAFLVLMVIMATPFGTFASARSSLNSHIEDYYLRITLLNIRTVSILALGAWITWRYAARPGLLPWLAPGRSRVTYPEIEQS